MTDTTYVPKISFRDGGDTLHVATGGKIEPEGGTVPTVAALTDSSGGTSGGNTVAAVTDAATAANAVATLTAKVNALRAALAAVGIIA